MLNVILSLLSRRLMTLMLVMSDLMGLNFFLVRDSGDWCEHKSLHHHHDAMVLVMGVVRLLTDVAVVLSKSHSYRN